MSSRQTKLHPVTIEIYGRITRMFGDWHITQYGSAPSMATLDDEVIDRYLRWSAARVSASSCRKRRAALHWARANAAHAKE